MTAPVAPLPEGETLPCPFCGEQPEIAKHFKEDAWRLVHRCDVMGALVLDWTEPRRRHVDTWNTRTAERRGRESAMADLRKIQNRIDHRLDAALCEMKEGYDDSIVGFNEAWDLVRKVFAEALSASEVKP